MTKQNRLHKIKISLARRQNVIFLALIVVGISLITVSQFTDVQLLSDGIAFIIVGCVGMLMSWTTMDIGTSIKEAIRDGNRQTRDENRQTRDENRQTRDKMTKSLDEMTKSLTESQNEMTKSLTESQNEMTKSLTESLDGMAKSLDGMAKSLNEIKNIRQNKN